MRMLVIQHPNGGTPGVFADEAAARGIALETWTPGAGETLPASDAAAHDGMVGGVGGTTLAGDPARYDGVVVLGGSENVDEVARRPYLGAEIDVLRGALARAQPVLGVCLGHQLLAAAAGAPVRPAPALEFGLHAVERTAAGAQDPLLSVMPETFPAYCWHSYEVDAHGLVPLATSPVSAQALRFGPNAWGVQFHPEVDVAVLEEWFTDWPANGDLIAAGHEREAARREAHSDALRVWMSLGRRLFGRFAELAAASRRPSAG